MNLYAESSAVLAWLLGESAAGAVADLLADADVIITSALTLVECDRVLLRGALTGRWKEGDAQDRRRAAAEAAGRWHLFSVTDDVLERARRSFPIEPVRTLDALHLATALVARGAVADLAVLSLDGRLRENASRLGFTLLPG